MVKWFQSKKWMVAPNLCPPAHPRFDAVLSKRSQLSFGSKSVPIAVNFGIASIESIPFVFASIELNPLVFDSIELTAGYNWNC